MLWWEYHLQITSLTCKLSPSLQHSSPHMPTPRSHANALLSHRPVTGGLSLRHRPLCFLLTHHQGKRAIYSLIPVVAILLGLIGLALLQGLQPLQSGHWSQSSNISHLILTCTMTPWNPVPCVKVSDNLFMWLYIFFFLPFTCIEVLLFYNVLIYAVKWRNQP